MARGIVSVLVLALSCFVSVGTSVAAPHRTGQGEGTAASPAASPTEPPYSWRLQSLGSGVTGALPDGPLLLRLDRLDVQPGGSLKRRIPSGPELLVMESGEAVVSDSFGVEGTLAADASLLLRPGIAYQLRNESSALATLLRVAVIAGRGVPASAAATDDWIVVGGTPTAFPELTILLQAPVPGAPPGPARVSLSRATWQPGAGGAFTPPNGPTGFFVESGTLTVNSPSGIEGRLPAGAGVVFPGGVTPEFGNAGTEPAVALVFGVVSEDDPIVRPPAEAPRHGPLTVAAVDIAWEYQGQRSAPNQPVVVPVAPGDTLTLPNLGAAAHNFVVPTLDNRVVDLPVGGAAEYTVPADTPPGDYEFICDLPGHEQAGHVGILRVREPGAAGAAAVPGTTPIPSEPTAVPDATITIEAFDIGWQYEGEQTAVGQPIRVPVSPGDVIALPNTGAAAHNFVVESLDNVVVDMPVGETATYTVPPDTPPGEYEFVCNLPGHEQAGMVGVLVVG